MIAVSKLSSNSHAVLPQPVLDAQVLQPETSLSKLILENGETASRIMLRAVKSLVPAEAEKLNACLNNPCQKAALNLTPAELGPSISFLLHGLIAPTAAGMAAKVEDNLRILLESKEMQASVLTETLVPRAPNGFRFELKSGKNEDICGFHLKLYRQDAEEFTPCLAKLGFFFDESSSSIVIQTIHGQRPMRLEPNQEFTQDLKSEKRAREKLWFRAINDLKKDPRVVLLQAIEAIAQEYFLKDIKALKASEHPYTIGQHKGFTGKYENVVRAANFLDFDEVYLQRKLR